MFTKNIWAQFWVLGIRIKHFSKIWQICQIQRKKEEGLTFCQNYCHLKWWIIWSNLIIKEKNPNFLVASYHSFIYMEAN